MRLITLTTALLSALTLSTAQTIDPAYIQAVIQALTGANLTSLANAAQSVANSTEGAAFLAQLQGSNKTLLAPSNEAFAAVDQSVASNTSLLANILSYHVLNASLTPSTIAIQPNHTISRSLYNNGLLPGNRSQPVVLYNTAEGLTNSSQALNGTGIVVQQGDGSANVNVTAGPVEAANFQIYVIDSVLSLPPTLTEAATTLLPSIAGVIQQANLLPALEAAQGLTIFAPNDAAVAALAGTLGTLNTTQIQTVLSNHVINGTVVYSTQLATSNYTSAGGQPFSFITNTTGAFVVSGTSTARIIASDILIQNGVVHVIDGILVNAASDPTAAQSAASSYQAEATATTAAGGGAVIGATTSMGAATSTSGGATATSAGAAIGNHKAGIMGVLGAVVLGGLGLGLGAALV